MDKLLEADILSKLKSSTTPIKAITIAKALELKKMDVNRVLYSLEKQGLVTMTPGTPPLWTYNSQSTPPIIVVTAPPTISAKEQHIQDIINVLRTLEESEVEYLKEVITGGKY